MTSPLRGGLLARNPLLRSWLHAGNVLARLLGAGRAAAPLPAPPARVLLCVGGHLGDAIIATAAIRDLQVVAPGVEIGLAVSPGAAAAVAGHPAVRWLHQLPHWRTDRSNRRLPSRLLVAWTARRRAVREIAAVGYDAAVDLCAHWPNAATVLYRAGIPHRIGWASGGMGALYTEALAWPDDGRHEAEAHRSLVTRLAPVSDLSWNGPPRYLMGDGSRDAREGMSQGLRELGVAGDYLVLHIGAGAPRKRWPAERWAGLARALVTEGEQLLLTGAGAEDRAVADLIVRSVPGMANGVDHFSWTELVEVVRRARGVICADTGVGHVAAGVGTPCVVMFAAIDRMSRWQPAGSRVVTLTREVPCAPCFRSRGCAKMACVREVREDEVLAALRTMVPRHSPMEMA